jgi:galactose mutarotase-like enzyme
VFAQESRDVPETPQAADETAAPAPPAHLDAMPYDQGPAGQEPETRDLHPTPSLTELDDTEPGGKSLYGTEPLYVAEPDAATTAPAIPESRSRSYPTRPVPPPTLPDGRDAMSPTGRQWTIGHGRQLAVVTEIGATLRSYDVDGVPVVDGFGPLEMSPSGRGQVLAPWPNRLGDGRYEFSGLHAQAALNEPDRRNAIHGLVRWLPWQADAHAQNVIVLRCSLYPSPAYPFCLELRIEYRLGRDGLSVTTTAGNEGLVTLPLGLGFHPYLTAGTDTVDTAMLQLPAASRLVTDDRGLPTGEKVPVAGTPYDFNIGRPIGDAKMDTAFTDLIREADGRAWACLAGPAGEGGVNLWTDDRFTHLMCFTGDTVADTTRRRRSVAIEPMTCGPDAFRTGRNLVVLEPGQEWQASWGLQPR